MIENTIGLMTEKFDTTSYLSGKITHNMNERKTGAYKLFLATNSLAESFLKKDIIRAEFNLTIFVTKKTNLLK